MSSKLENIVKSCKSIAEQAKFVKINYDKIDDIVANIDQTKIKYWLDSNPFNIMEFDVASIVNFLLIYHTVGDYCFWGNPKWEIETEDGSLDGSFAMIYLLIKKFKYNQNFDLTFEEFKELLSGKGEIPLLQDRYHNLLQMNAFLKEQGTDFYTLIKQYTIDKDIFNYIISNLSYFIDESIYNDNIVYFYKRVQLLTSDILHVRELKEGINVDYSHLVGCADYKIPQVMRCYGILEFNQELAYLVDNKIEIDPDSEMENEIRACDIVVIDYIAKKLGNKISRIDINDYLWLLGQDKSHMTKNYHRTLTNKY